MNQTAGLVDAPSVLVVLIARNGEPWLRDCLAGLARQDYPRLGVVGVDCGSDDASRELLTKALGSDRVSSSPASLGEILTAVRERPGAADVDYFLVLHDDAVLEPDAILRMVQAAITSAPVGVVGPKLVDWDDPRVLREIGWSADRFGHPYSPLEPGEIDQGQHDRIAEVLFVSSAAMLITREALDRAGPPDDRLGMDDLELDFCWRVRLTGLPVLAAPQAVVRHRDAGRRGERPDDRSATRRRYLEERGAGVAVAKDYGLGSIWVIPLYLVQGVLKLLFLLISRRFGEMGQIVAAWGWNLLHFPGTVLRRVKIQPARRVKDRDIHRFMAHGSVRFRRWLDAAGRIFPGDVDLPDDEDYPQESLRSRASTAARGHPVAAAWVAAFVLAVLAYRPVISAANLQGGWLPASLPPATSFLQELGSGFRSTALGGVQAASPALAVWGGLGSVPLVEMTWVEKFLLCVLPIAGGVTAYRMALRLTGHVAGSLAAAGAYALSGLALWSFSTGRLPLLVVLAVLPKVAERLDMAFGREPPARRVRFMVGTGVFVAFGVAFDPGIVLAIAVLALSYLLVPSSARRLPGGIALTLGFAVVGLALVFPLTVDAVAADGAHLTSLVGVPDVASLSRLALVPGTGGWPISWFLPVSAVLGFMVADAEHRRTALRCFLAAVGGVFLGWAAAAGWLPAPLSNPGTYLAAAAVSCAALVAIGVGSVREMARGFSLRRLTGLVLMGVLCLGLALQAVPAALGFWDIGQGKLPAAWPLVSAGAQSHERVLWIGRVDGRPFLPPGGDPTGVMEAGESSVRYALTDRVGASALDIGRPSWGSGYDALEAAFAEMRAGGTIHGGALLGPLGVRYIVAADGDVPAELRAVLDRQIDLDMVPAGGLVIYRNAAVWPVAEVVQGEPTTTALEAGDPQSVAEVGVVDAVAPLEPVKGGWNGTGEGTAWVADQYDASWRLTAGPATSRAREALGWAMAFQAPGRDLEIRFDGQGQHTTEMWALAVLWALALWFTRKPVRR